MVSSTFLNVYLSIDNNNQGTIFFISQLLLFQLSEAISSIPMFYHSFKYASNSHAIPAHLIIYHYEDNLESVLYVFVQIYIRYRGTLGIRHMLDKSHNQLLHKQSTTIFKNYNNNNKTTFFYYLHVHKFKEQFHSYFKNLVPLVVEQYKLIRSKKLSCVITFQEVLDLLDKHLFKLPKELSSEILFAQKVLKELPAPKLPVAIMDPAVSGKNSKQKLTNTGSNNIVDQHGLIIVWDVTHGGQIWTMRPNILQPKHNRTT